jgi:hypothetical protein
MLIGNLLIALYCVSGWVGSVGVETGLLAGQSGVRIPTRAKIYLQNIRTGCGAYPIRRGSGLFPEDKAAGA